MHCKQGRFDDWEIPCPQESLQSQPLRYAKWQLSVSYTSTHVIQQNKLKHEKQANDICVDITYQYKIQFMDGQHTKTNWEHFLKARTRILCLPQASGHSELQESPHFMFSACVLSPTMQTGTPYSQSTSKEKDIPLTWLESTILIPHNDIAKNIRIMCSPPLNWGKVAPWILQWELSPNQQRIWFLLWLYGPWRALFFTHWRSS